MHEILVEGKIAIELRSAEVLLSPDDVWDEEKRTSAGGRLLRCPKTPLSLMFSFFLSHILALAVFISSQSDDQHSLSAPTSSTTMLFPDTSHSFFSGWLLIAISTFLFVEVRFIGFVLRYDANTKFACLEKNDPAWVSF